MDNLIKCIYCKKLKHKDEFVMYQTGRNIGVCRDQLCQELHNNDVIIEMEKLKKRLILKHEEEKLMECPFYVK